MTPEEKAQEIDRALKDRKDADQALNDKLDTIIGSVGDLGKRMDAIEAKHATKNEDEDDENDDRSSKTEAAQELVKAQARADSVSMLFGTQAPRPMDGERPLAYRRRLLGHFQHNSQEFKELDLAKIRDAATFDAIESRIYADSTAAAATPQVAPGCLRQVQTRDESGRQISKFYGEPRAWMQQFMSEPSLVEKINKSSGLG